MNTRLADMWDVLICPNNHPCFLVTKPIYYGDPISSAPLRALGKMEMPRSGVLVKDIVCSICQEPVFANIDGKAMFRKQVRKDHDQDISQDNS